MGRLTKRKQRSIECRQSQQAGYLFGIIQAKHEINTNNTEQQNFDNLIKNRVLVEV